MFSPYLAIFIFIHFVIYLDARTQCDDCRNLVADFHRGVDGTKDGGFLGGDVFWEELNLKNYAKSELRFIEILEKVCENGKFGCLKILEKHEDDLLEWWEGDRKVELFEWFCVGKVAQCCPEGTYGPECLPCLKWHDKICSGYGKCVGSGTRGGDGSCHCDTGYRHDNCTLCSHGYYKMNIDDNFSCVKCDTKCNGCDGPGASGCVACSSGFRMADGKCEDIDECDTNEICLENEVCSNTDGSYSCECIPGYQRGGKECVEDSAKEDL
ncbi:Cysteine-rich with EGF-like domain protein 2 isoform X3 [Oopsacas minuta]|uniref:Cysteine-rich with EGF-like domain protein 2 isoform X3 n=1 Tax=Oopsacas minuta TaxID=111878 RepID=A0AAV7K5L5_9METZ|nr:Cysteine-rich with EGF-like domain protein 2 isoform X3 [Oopsacas minuta]